MRKLRRLLQLPSLIALSILISACHSTKTDVTEIIIPARPTLPPLSEEQKNSIREDVFLILVEREITLLEYLDRIDDVIAIYNEDR